MPGDVRLCYDGLYIAVISEIGFIIIYHLQCKLLNQIMVINIYLMWSVVAMAISDIPFGIAKQYLYLAREQLVCLV